jgi:ketosteroid isomerase-like protein
MSLVSSGSACPNPAHPVTFVILCFAICIARAIVWLLFSSQRPPHEGIRRTAHDMIRNVFCCLLLTLGSVGYAFSQQADASQEGKLVVLEHMWNEAQVNRDAPVLNALVAETFVNTEYDGEVSDKTKFLADIADPLYKPASMNVDGLKVSFYHDAAVVTGNYHAKGTYQGKPYDHVGRFTDTWVSQNGKWICVASHSSLQKK